MRLLLVSVSGLVLLTACASAPMQSAQPMEPIQPFGTVTNCDYAQMNRVDRVEQPYLLGRYWVNCPQLRNKAATAS